MSIPKNTKKHDELADVLGRLLAESNLDDETKELILDKAGELPEHAIYKLIQVLQGEQRGLGSLAFDLDLFLSEQNKNWAKVREEQKNAAAVIANKWLANLS